MGVTVVEGLDMLRGTARVGVELVITAVGMDIWLGIAPVREEVVEEGLVVVIPAGVLIVGRMGILLGIVLNERWMMVIVAVTCGFIYAGCFLFGFMI
jgi:hypothetical protein